MSKYDPLQEHLEHVAQTHFPMRFEEIESILGFRLPASSRHHRAWWSNNPSNNVMTKSWLNAGFETEAVDIDQRRLVFRRVRPGRPVGSLGPQVPRPAPKPTRHPIFGLMKGTVTLRADVDLTAPADPDWAALSGGDGDA